MSRPNIIVVTLHDTGRHFGAYGIPTVQTPAFDTIASQGVLMTRYFAAVPICGASRTSMLTGLYPARHGHLDLPIWGYDIKPGVKHMSHRLRDAGYQTHLFGIQHETGNVQNLAFDDTHPEVKNPSGKGRPKAPDVARHFADFLRAADKSRPIYAQIGLFETHSPFDFDGTPEDHDRGVYVPKWIKPNGPAYELMAKLQGALRQADIGVGIIDQAIRDAGLYENTLLVVTVDHGLELPRAKWHLFDPGVEIGLAARWPGGGVTGGRKVDQLSCNIDFTPTVMDLAGLEPDPTLDGRSLAQLWRGESDAPLHEEVYGYYLKTQSRSIRTMTHKVIISGTTYLNPKVPFDILDTARNTPIQPVEFYDLQADPLETINLAKSPEHQPLLKDLLRKLREQMTRCGDEMLEGPLRFTWYDQAMAALNG